jgi:4-phospho-D-threonate 3-dehydrogenase / 4-phospho-D-erythronate 3-dehydrogenase
MKDSRQSLDKAKIAITIGDPAGVGTEVTLKALSQPDVRDAAEWIIVCDRIALDAASRVTGVVLEQTRARLLDIGALGNGSEIVWGALRADYGFAAAEYVRIATGMCLRGEVCAMVTAPLNKEAVALSGLSFSGHTEYIAGLCGASDSCMMLAGRTLAVAHVSTHIRLRDACELKTDRIIRTITLGNDALKLMGIARPRIAVCGLNPHAGEHGLFGREDEDTITPAVQHVIRNGIVCDGPLPADTLFVKASRGAYDLVVAMYHDQGHIAMKLLDFEGTVNVSLGIPIIRTSVDHGTAFDIAGKNEASAENMKSALLMAALMARRRHNSTPEPTNAKP